MIEVNLPTLFVIALVAALRACSACEVQIARAVPS